MNAHPARSRNGMQNDAKIVKQLSMLFAAPRTPETARDPTGQVDVSECAQDAGMHSKVSISTELLDTLRRTHSGDTYESEAVLWDILMLAKFEQSLNPRVPIFTFAASIRTRAGSEELRLRYTSGDPILIEIAHQNPTRRFL